MIYEWNQVNSLIKTKEEALTSFALYNLYRRNTAREQLTSEIMSRIVSRVDTLS